MSLKSKASCLVKLSVVFWGHLSSTVLWLSLLLPLVSCVVGRLARLDAWAAEPQSVPGPSWSSAVLPHLCLLSLHTQITHFCPVYPCSPRTFAELVCSAFWCRGDLPWLRGVTGRRMDRRQTWRISLPDCVLIPLMQKGKARGHSANRCEIECHSQTLKEKPQHWGEFGLLWIQPECCCSRFAL